MKDKSVQVYSELSRHFIGGLKMCTDFEEKADHGGMVWEIMNKTIAQE